MAVLCLANDLKDLKEMLGRIIVAYNYDGEPVTAKDLKAVGSMAALLKEAIKPNMIQTLEHTPAIVHGGPFANIAHGCNSVRATKMALKLADYVITEAGFGADLGAEKFFDIKCRKAGFTPSAVLLLRLPEAVEAMLRRQFQEMGAERVWCAHFPGNERSRRVQEKCGFRHVCDTPPSPWPDGTEHPGVCQAITRQEWEVRHG